MSQRLLLIALFLIGFWRPAVADEAEAPLRITNGLFDMSNTRTLGLDTLPVEHVEVHHASKASGFRFSHHPGLAVFKGRFYCSWSSGHFHEDRPGQRVLYASSLDGKIWSKAQVLAMSKNKQDCCIASGFYVAGDKLVAYYTAKHDYPEHNLFNPKNAVFARTSTDGANWSEPRKVAAGFFIEGPHRLPSGKLLLAGEHTGKIWMANQGRMRLLYSDELDGVSGWKEARIDPSLAQPSGLKVFGYTEPCPFVRPDGAIVSPFRNQSGFLYASISHDNGITWSVPHQTTFPDSMSRSSTGRLPNGTVFLINNPGPGRGNRSLLTIALSDDGVTFDRAWLIHGEPTAQRFAGKGKRDGWQYPHALVWRDSLYVVCSVNKEDIVLSQIPLDILESRSKDK